jgi:hypothetical protein
MTQDEIIALAKQVGFPIQHPHWQKAAEEFAALVEEKATAIEREACAKVCDELIAPDIYSDTDVSMWDVTCMDCATAIRARGQA